ncbi:MAG: antibiotic biosynthesis monooxygenase [Bacillota bacterium]
MIARIWHGYTTPENADEYENLLYEEVWKSIEGKKLKGYKGIELLKRKHEDEVEFITIMRFNELSDVIEFTGEDYTRAYVPQKAQMLLKRFDSHSQHYEQLSTIKY